METIASFVQRAADRTGFSRERYIERNIPTNYSSFLVVMCFGDMRSEFILSSLLLHRFKNLHNSSYLIVCGYSGHAHLFPYAQEYWGLKDKTVIPELLTLAKGFHNTSEKVKFYEQQLNRFFENVQPATVFDTYYHNGLTQEYFDKFGDIIYELPAIVSPTLDLSKQLNMGQKQKVFIYPSLTFHGWHRGKEHIFKASADFWKTLARRLLENDIVPVICHSSYTHDISPEFGSKCIYCNGDDVSSLLAGMRATGCVIDVFNDISRFAIIARAPFVCCTDRSRYFEMKEYELDDLCCQGLPHQYIFSFATMIEAGQWADITDSIINKLTNFTPNCDTLPSSGEMSITVAYDRVRIRKSKRIGTKFIKVEKL